MAMLKNSDWRAWYFSQGGGQGQRLLINCRGAVWDSVTVVSQHPTLCCPRSPGLVL